MIDYSSSYLITLRRFAQRLGIARGILQIYRRIFSIEYEKAFHNALISSLSPGENVWDVGANQGYYVDIFHRIVGDKGSVVAFEPSPQSASDLRSRFANVANIFIKEVALSDNSGRAEFFISEDSTTNGLHLKPESEAITVTLNRGDDFLSDNKPNVIKIDVEGFELEVLRGMRETLSCQSLHHVFVEVHFQELSNRGLKYAPMEIVKCLTDAGFSVSWTDSSHIEARR